MALKILSLEGDSIRQKDGIGRWKTVHTVFWLSHQTSVGSSPYEWSSRSVMVVRLLEGGNCPRWSPEKETFGSVVEQ